MESLQQELRRLQKGASLSQTIGDLDNIIERLEEARRVISEGPRTH